MALASYAGAVALTDDLIAAVLAAGHPDKAAPKAAFLQAVPGGYAEGDVVVAASVPAVRAIARSVRDRVALADLAVLLEHEVHEVRLLACILMGDLAKLRRTPPSLREELAFLAIERCERLNNWDLVDTVAPHVTGP